VIAWVVVCGIAGVALGVWVVASGGFPSGALDPVFEALSCSADEDRLAAELSDDKLLTLAPPSAHAVGAPYQDCELGDVYAGQSYRGDVDAAQLATHYRRAAESSGWNVETTSGSADPDEPILCLAKSLADGTRVYADVWFDESESVSVGAGFSVELTAPADDDDWCGPGGNLSS
jgi:hypothetical protein